MEQYLDKDTLFENIVFNYKDIKANVDKYMPWLNYLDNNNFKSYTYPYDDMQPNFDRKLCTSNYSIDPMIEYIATEDEDGDLIPTEYVLNNSIPLYLNGEEKPNIRVWYKLGEIVEYIPSRIKNYPVCVHTRYSKRDDTIKCYFPDEDVSTKYYNKSDLIVKSMLHIIHRDDLIVRMERLGLKSQCINPYKPICNEIYIASRNENYDIVKNFVLCPTLSLNGDYTSKNHTMCLTPRKCENYILKDISVSSIKDFIMILINYKEHEPNEYRDLINNLLCTLFKENSPNFRDVIQNINVSCFDIYEQLKKICIPPQITNGLTINTYSKKIDELCYELLDYKNIFLKYIIENIHNIFLYIPSIIIREILNNNVEIKNEENN